MARFVDYGAKKMNGYCIIGLKCAIIVAYQSISTCAPAVIQKPGCLTFATS